MLTVYVTRKIFWEGKPRKLGDEIKMNDSDGAYMCAQGKASKNKADADRAIADAALAEKARADEAARLHNTTPGKTLNH